MTTTADSAADTAAAGTSMSSILVEPLANDSSAVANAGIAVTGSRPASGSLANPVVQFLLSFQDLVSNWKGEVRRPDTATQDFSMQVDAS